MNADTRAKRFPLEMELNYRAIARKGSLDQTSLGKTVNISSSGVLFTTQERMPFGRKMELNISWPALLDKKVPWSWAALSAPNKMVVDGKPPLK